HVAVADVEYLHALGVGVLGELDGAGDRARDLGGAELVPRLQAEALAGLDVPDLVGRVVEHGFVDIEHDSRRQVGEIALLLDRRGGPLLVSQGLVEPHLGECIDGEGIALELDRALGPQRRLQQVIGLRLLSPGDAGSQGKGDGAERHGLPVDHAATPFNSFAFSVSSANETSIAVRVILRNAAASRPALSYSVPSVVWKKGGSSELSVTRTPASIKWCSGCAARLGYRPSARLLPGQTSRAMPRRTSSSNSFGSSLERTPWPMRVTGRSRIAAQTLCGPWTSPAWMVQPRPFSCARR